MSAAEPLTIRPATEADCRLLWEWVNEPAVRASAFHSALIPWEEHEAWFRRKLADRACFLYIAVDRRGEPVGQVRFDLQPDGRADIDLSIAKAHRQRGCGAQALRLACERAQEAARPSRWVARIKPENHASIRTFEKAGFAWDNGAWTKPCSVPSSPASA